MLGKKAFIYIGLFLIAIGCITLLSSVGHYRILGTIPWLFLDYALMDILLGLGFYMREKWILPLLALNFGGYTLLNAVNLIYGPSPDLIHIGVNILAAGLLCGVVYIARDQLVETRWGSLQAVAFILLWALAYVSVATATLLPII